MRWACGFALAGVLMWCGHSLAEQPQPYVLVRAMTDLQKDFLQGDTKADARLQEFLTVISSDLARMDDSVWKDERNVHSLAVYILTGGDAGPARRLVAAKSIPGSQLELLSAVIAVYDGAGERARDLLSKVDAMRLPATTGAYVALSQGTLAGADDAAQAQKKLAVARMLAPGTLIEETSLRRAALIATRQQDAGKTSSFVSRYLHRFPTSVYSAEFLARIRDEVMSWPMETLAAAESEGHDVLGFLPTAEARSRRLALARRAIASGPPESARILSGRLLEKSGADPVLQSRAKLYAASSLITTPARAEARALLSGIKPAELEAEDRALLAAIRALDARIEAPAATPSNTADAGNVAPTPVMATALAKLEESGRLLARGVP